MRNEQGKDGQARGKYTLEFKLKELRFVIGCQAVSVTAKVPGVPVQALGNWVRLSEKRQLERAGDKPASVEQLELIHRTKYKAIPVEKPGSRRSDSIAYDLPPINRTSHFSKKSVDMENDGHENEQILRRADHWISEASRSRYANQGDRAQARLQ